ncbi:SAM-dependent methyltransferase [Streptomyces avicenniae]|uniref:SAM-dependent methyltransferase n=1 Tax=Streptomyces avicenniae TaxID=500153 RepID=UPI00069C9F90|nr:SAM-dependent methyltransferase [Streptomyces avicenniae]
MGTGDDAEAVAGSRARLEAVFAAGPPRPEPWDGFTGPSRARVRDFYLGGKDHYAVDRRLAAELADAWPQIAHAAVALRAAMHASAAHAVAELGMRQVLVTDYGYPTQSTSGPDLHTTARDATGDEVTVLHLEPDPVAAAHLRASTGHGQVTVLRADIAADPVNTLRHVTQEGALDPDRPVCVLLPEALARTGDPTHALRALARVLPPGSVLMAATPDDQATARHAATLAERHHLPFHVRNATELHEILAAAGFRRGVSEGAAHGLVWRVSARA